MDSSATKNKWLKYLFLKRSPQLAAYVPETRIMAWHSFWGLLAKYKHVIVKPVRGSRGRGVIQVSSIGNNRYALHYENSRFTLRGKENTYKYVSNKMGSESYMVQRRIARPTINDRPFDMRVIIQRKSKSGTWVVTAKIAKVAGRGYIVSNNSRSKGDLLMVPTAFRRSTIKHLSVQNTLAHIDRISILTAQRLAAYFPWRRIYGLDVALDQHGHVWIIEANLYPSMSHFLKLKDRTLLRRINAYRY